MSELRRVSLQPASHTDRFGMGEPPGSTKPAVKKKKKLTMRFNLDLGNPADGECHEFNYIELVRNFKRGKSEVAQETDDPFDSDDDVAAIAKQMEEKYGSGKVAWDDDVDKGQGYDEDDSFIDNREAYDELVPLDLNTKHGGFYINTGDLEFVHAPPVQYMQYHQQNDVNKTKATLEESPEEESEEESEREPSPKPSKADKIKVKRKRKKIESDDSKDKDQGSGEKRKKLLKKKSKKIESSSEDEEDEKEQKELDKKELEKKEKLSMKQERQLDDAIEAVVRHARALNKKEVEEEETEVLRLQEEEMEREERENERKRKEKEKSDRLEREKLKVSEKEREKVDLRLENTESGSMRLPDRMPSELEAMVKDITKVAKEGLGKSKFFLANGVSERLLSIDMMARQSLPCSQRTQLYCYLAAHLPCSKETLLKKVKKLRLDEEDSKIKEPMTRFKNELNQMVFDQVEMYRRKCEEVGQKPCGTSDSEGEDDIQIHRQFEWTENLKKLFREVVLLKLKTYEVSKLRATSAEDYVKNFFDIDMIKLWPRGWMSSRILLRMIREENLLPRARNDGTPNQVKKLGQLQNLSSANLNDTPTSTPASVASTPQSTPYRPRLNSVSSAEIPLKDSSFKDSLQEMTPPMPTTSVIKEKVKQESPVTPLNPQREHREPVTPMQSVISETGALNSVKDERLLTPPPSEPTETPVHLSVITSSPAKQFHAPTSLPQVETPVFGDSFLSTPSPSAPSKKHSATPLLKANYQAALQKSPPYTASALQAQAFAEFSQKASPTTSVVNFSQGTHKSSNHQTTSSTPAHSSSQYSSPANSIAPTSSYQQKYQSPAAQLQPAHQSSAYHQSSSHSAASYFGSQNSQSQNSREKETLLAADVFDRIITQQLGNSVNTPSQSAYSQQPASYQSSSMLSPPASHRSSGQNHSQSQQQQTQQQQQQQQQQKTTQLPRATMPSSYNIYEALQQQPQQPKSRELKMPYSQSQQHSAMVANAQMLQHLHNQQQHQQQQQQRNTSNLEGMKGFPSPMSSSSSVPSYYTSSAAASAYQQQNSQVPQVAHSSSITSTSNRYSSWGTPSGMYSAHQQRQYYQQQHQQDPRRLLLQQQQQQHQQQQQDLHRQH